MRLKSGGTQSNGEEGRSALGKTIVMGVAQRESDTHAVVIPDIENPTLCGVALQKVDAGGFLLADKVL